MPGPIDNTDQFITSSEVQEYLHISASTLAVLRQQPELNMPTPVKSFNRAIRYKRNEMLAWMDNWLAEEERNKIKQQGLDNQLATAFLRGHFKHVE